MSEKGDMYKKAKEEMRLSERILAALPGFRGYKEKELRRESDKLIRNHLYLKLSKVKTDVRGIHQKLADRRSMDVLNDIDRLVAKVDRITEKVNHASYGYSGFFDVVKIQEASLDRMIDFDTKLIDGVDKIVEEVKSFKDEIGKHKFDTASSRIESLTEAVDAFEEVFDQREEVILGVN